MFRSRARPIIFPQSEHARLAATVAHLWGNAQFDRPALANDSFVIATLLHDRGYGYFDTSQIDNLSDEQWLTIQRQALTTALADPIADVMILFHIKRLFSYRAKPEHHQFLSAIDSKLSRAVEASGIDYETFRRTDKLVDLCDSIAFDFCFEADRSGSVEVYAKNNTDDSTTVSYSVRQGGVIELSPWPLRVQKFSSFIVAYSAASYPEQREPVIVPFAIQPQTH